MRRARRKAGEGGRRRFALAALLFGAGCSTPPYQPALLFLPGAEGPGLPRACLPALRALFPRMEEVGGERLLSEWVSAPAGDTAVRRRLEIVAEPRAGGTLLFIAVKRIRIGAAVRGDPVWVSEGGDLEWEARVLELLRAELGGTAVTPRAAPGRRPAPPGSG